MSKNESEIQIIPDRFETRMKIKHLSYFDIYSCIYPEDADKCKDDRDKTYKTRKIRNWKDGFAMPKTVNELLKLCDLFDCDVDYLIGKQDVVRRDNLNAIERTGLSETTINEISELPLSEKHIVDALFSRTSGSYNLIKTIKQMLFYAHPDVDNNTHIVLDDNLKDKDKEYTKLEETLNQTALIDIFSYRLGIIMRDIITVLSQDQELTKEISIDYRNKHFHSHKKTLNDEDLIRLGNIHSNKSYEIERTEKKILDLLSHRDSRGNNFDYHIGWLHTKNDFSDMLQQKRQELSEDDYFSWLIDIEEKIR